MKNSLSEPVVGQVDAENNLICADQMLLRLHLHCGGHERGRLAIPQLAEICQHSRRLNMKLARLIIAADEDEAVTMWVETQPNVDGTVNFKILDWQNSPFKQDRSEDCRKKDFERLDTSLIMRIDASLRVVSVAPGFEFSADQILVGQSLFDIFNFLPQSQQSFLTETVTERQPIRSVRVQETYGQKILHSFWTTTHKRWRDVFWL